MHLAQRIQAKTDNGDTIIDFLVEVMNGERDDFKICHRLDAARLLTNYGCSCKSAVAERHQAIDFIVDNPSEPSRRGTSSRDSRESLFDTVLAKKIQESTDDGATVCRFLINVMEGNLKQFKPRHRISAARELLSRGFGQHAREEASRRSGGGRNPEEGSTGGPNPSIPGTQASESEESPNPTDHSSDNNPEEEIPWDEINEIIDVAIEESNRKMAEQPGPDPDNPPHVPDYSAFDKAMENSDRWFEEWKNSIDPEEYQAIIKETSERFSAKLDARIERRKQIKKDREHRAKEEAEREAQQAKARAEVKVKAEAEAKEEEDLGPPPAGEDHERWSPTPNIPTSFRLRNCGHPKCKLHDGPIYYPEDDRSSPYYNPGIPPPSFRTYPF